LVTLAAVSLLVLKLDDSEVAGVYRRRLPDFEADVDVVLFAFFFLLGLSVSVLYDMTLFHSCAVWSGLVAATVE
jgi:hypothetical protein